MRSQRISKSLPVIILASYGEQRICFDIIPIGNSCLIKSVDAKKFVQNIDRPIRVSPTPDKQKEVLKS
ncbi:hypothetical protein LEP1GSC050_1813 [Leptospira broomii serovar Hurstbridge str. 5399]|uniref:Uncharacterized protein n=1 Tax=Leptospira broomii serovar Hurstbridge str. 5399 TaxID=1049789 RepID=T0FH95_9LEPT|nr:hypothetical protein LEP1GSC050_1813 [Leptospira broomii serovar Hurstbridge str. 5399]